MELGTYNIAKVCLFPDTMKILQSSIIALLMSVATASILDADVYKAESLLYTARNDIVDIHSSKVNTDILFIVERILPDGDFKGLYALKTADHDYSLISTKVLDNGKCTDSDNSVVYIGASNGIYTYNFNKKKAEMYGNITADVKAIQKHANKDVIYAIANDQLNKITEKGTVMKKIESVNDVQEIVLDEDNNLYLYEKRDANAKNFKDNMYSKPKVIVNDNVIDVKGLPDNYSQMKLFKSFGFTEGVILLLDNRFYRMFSNGTSARTEYTFENAPTACYLNLGIIQLYSYDRKLYQFNIIGLVLQGLNSAIGDFYKSIFGN